MSVYVVDVTSKYEATVSVVRDVEDAPMSFYTYEEVQAMRLLVNHWSMDDAHLRVHTGECVRYHMIRSELAALKAKMQADGVASIDIGDVDLVEVLKKRRIRVGCLVPGVVRSGNRLKLINSKILADRERKKQVVLSMWRIVTSGLATFNHRQPVEVDITYVDRDRLGAVAIVRTLFALHEMTFDDIKFEPYDDEATVACCREIWDNPSEFADLQ